MKDNKITKNYLFNLTSQMVTLLSPIITTPYLSKVLGVSGIGTYSFRCAIVNYFLLFAALGTNTYGQREISYLQDERECCSKAFGEIEIISLLSSGIAIVLYCLMGFFYHEEILFFVFAINIVAVAFDISWLFQGLEDFRVIAQRNIFIKIINLVFIFLFVKSKNDLIVYAIGQCIFQLFSSIVLWIKIEKYIDIKVNYFRINTSRIIGSFTLLVPNIAITLYNVIDKTMLGLLDKSMVQNGYYEQALKFSKLTLTIITSLVAVIIPRMGYLYNKGEENQIHEILYFCYKFVWFLGAPLYLGILGICDNLIPWFWGEDFWEIKSLFPILGLLIIIIGLSNITGFHILVPRKLQSILTFSVILGAIVNVILNILFIPRLYALGAAFTTVVSEVVVCAVQLVAVRNYIEINKVLFSGIRYCIIGLIMYGILFIEGNVLATSIISTVLMIISGATVYLVINLIIKDELTIFLIKQIKRQFVKH